MSRCIASKLLTRASGVPLVAAWFLGLLSALATAGEIAPDSILQGPALESPSVLDGDTLPAPTDTRPAQRSESTLPLLSDLAPAPLDDDACMAELRRCCCCPGWDHYAIFDVLFLQRNNQAGNQPLAINTDTGATALSVQDIQAAVAPGVRLFYGRLLTDHVGWEVGYTGIYGMFGDATAFGDDNLTFPDPIGTNFEPGDQVRATNLTTLNMFEANFFYYNCCEECGPFCRRSCHCSRCFVGFMWAGLDDQSTLTALCCDPPEPSTYSVRTSTNYFGPQIGQWGRREWCRWAVEGWWKAGVCGTSAYQSQDPIISALSGEVRPARSGADAGVGFVGGLNGTVIYRLTDVWGLRAGYNCYWLTSAALAPTQYDFGTFADSGSGINDNGSLFLHGVNLGVEARW